MSSSKQLRVAIDASNIRAGGGVTHLRELLAAAKPDPGHFSEVVLWASSGTLEKIKHQSWLIRRQHSLLEAGIVGRLIWRHFFATRAFRKLGCGLLLVPGGSYSGNFRPFVAMAQNLLPFDRTERGRFFPRVAWFRYRWLARAQKRTFERAAGVIHLSDVARGITEVATGFRPAQTRVIHHGIHKRFFAFPRSARLIEERTPVDPFRLCYVSVVAPYKHQDKVATAVASLRRQNIPVVIDFVGPAYGPALLRLEAMMRALDPEKAFLRYRGYAPHDEVERIYQAADAFVFGSSCETFGLIVLEAMAAGLPIACSARSAMPEVLGDAGVYFDPEDPDDIAKTLTRLLRDPEKRAQLAEAAHERARMFSWERCARETFSFLAECAGSEPC